jgi:dTDP-glucose 4,6-dehydratase
VTTQPKHMVITGGAGFIGSHLSDVFLAEGWRVTVVDDLSTGTLDNLEHLANESRFDVIEQNVSDWLPRFTRVDAILHLASPASPKDYLERPIETMRVGAEGTRHCLDLATERGATFLLTSTSEVYGDPLVHPQTEDYWGNVNPHGFRSVYDEAKRFAEAMTFAYRRTHGTNTRVVRLFNTYGPRMRIGDGRVVPAFMEKVILGQPLQIHGDGNQTRSFGYVADTIEGIRRMLHSDHPGPINIGNPEERSIRDLAELCIEIFGTGQESIEFGPLPDDDPKVRRPDISLAREVLGWDPTISLREGLLLSADYFRDAVKAAHS